MPSAALNRSFVREKARILERREKRFFERRADDGASEFRDDNARIFICRRQLSSCLNYSKSVVTIESDNRRLEIP